MRLTKSDLLTQYKSILLEIEKVKKRVDLDALYRKEQAEKLEAELQEKIKNGTATALDHWTPFLCCKINRDDSTPDLVTLLQEINKNSPAYAYENWLPLLRFEFKHDYSDPELTLLNQKARNLVIEILGEEVAFPTIQEFLKRITKKINKLLKYLSNDFLLFNHPSEDKRPLIAQFRKLLIKVNCDDVDNSTTQIKNIINRVLNFHIKQNGYVIRYKKSNYQHLVMQ